MNSELKQNNLTWVWIVSLIAVLFTFAQVEAKEAHGITGNTIKIGVIADLTGPTAIDISAPVVAAVRTYFRNVNDNGGIHNRKFNLIVEDDRYSIPLSFSAFKKLIFRNKVFAVFGPISSGSALALLGQIQKEKVPNICYGLSKKMTIPTKRYIFAVMGNYEVDISMVFEYIFNTKKIKSSPMAIVYPDVEVGKLGLRAAIEESKRFGAHLHKQVLNLGALDATSQVLNLRRAKAKHILVHSTPASAATLLRAARKFGLKADFYGTTVTTNEDLLELAGHAAKNFIGVHSHNSWYQKDSLGCAEIAETMVKYHNKVPYNNKLLCAGWVSAVILAEGIKRAGENLDRESLVNSLEGLRDFDPKNITGPITYSPTDHSGPEYRRLFRTDVEEKRFVGITKWIRPKE